MIFMKLNILRIDEDKKYKDEKRSSANQYWKMGTDRRMNQGEK